MGLSAYLHQSPMSLVRMKSRWFSVVMAYFSLF